MPISNNLNDPPLDGRPQRRFKEEQLLFENRLSTILFLGWPTIALITQFFTLMIKVNE
jgi:hypothetical protein